MCQWTAMTFARLRGVATWVQLNTREIRYTNVDLYERVQGFLTGLKVQLICDVQRTTGDMMQQA